MSRLTLLEILDTWTDVLENILDKMEQIYFISSFCERVKIQLSIQLSK